MTNDPFEGGTHSCDIALIKPIFVDGRLFAFAISVAHWSEVGGAVPGSISPTATEIYQEGVRFPGIRVCRDDETIDDVIALIRENVRLPVQSLGDLNAGLAAVRIAETRLREIIARYGVDAVAGTFRHILEASERLSRAAVTALPDGDYEAEDWIDGDGISDERFRVAVIVRIRGDTMTFDFTGTSPMVKGPINCAFGALDSAVKTVFKSLVDPQAPSNEGWFRPVSLVCPPGTVFTAEKPAPTGWYYEGSAHASELAWKALAEVAPERFSAGSYMSLAGTYFYGRDPESGEVYVHIEPAIGGWGATASDDGTSALIATTDGDTYNYSVELFEAKFPLAIRRYALNTEDGAGAGRHRGGFGVVREFEVAGSEGHTYCSIGRSIERPWGLEGGGEGSNNYMRIESNGSVERVARIPYHALSAGDRVAVVTGGGGGFGDPFTRPAAAVAADVADGYISAARADERVRRRHCRRRGRGRDRHRRAPCRTALNRERGPMVGKKWKWAVLFSGDNLTLEETIDFAASAEDAGAESLWTTELGRDAFVPLAGMAARCKRARLGTGVAIFARPPALTEISAMSMAELTNGRFVLGLGTAPPAWNENWHGLPYHRPVRRMREYVEAIRLMWTANPETPIEYEGEIIHRARLSPRAGAALCAAADLSRRRAAGDAAFDGGDRGRPARESAQHTALFFRHRAAQHRQGAGQGGTDARRYRALLAQGLFRGPRPAAGQAAGARGPIAFYSCLPYFDQVLDPAGFTREKLAIRDAWERADLAAMTELVTDDMVDALVLAGTPDDVRSQLDRFDGLFETVLLYCPMPFIAREESLANHAAMIEAFAD